LVCRERVPVAINNQCRIDGNGSLDARKRDRAFFEMVSGRRHDADLLTVVQNRIAGLGEHRIGTVEVQAHEPAGWMPDIVNFCDCLLTRVTAFGQVNRGTEPVEFVGKRQLVNLGKTRAPGDGANRIEGGHVNYASGCLGIDGHQ
jgi:hypothetical protein